MHDYSIDAATAVYVLHGIASYTYSDILRYNGGQFQVIFESSDLNLMGHQVIRVTRSFRSINVQC